MNIKNMVNDNKKVKFQFYMTGDLWYETECGFQFPVPIKEAGNARFFNEDKALLFMRYIRKYIKVIEDEKNRQK